MHARNRSAGPLIVAAVLSIALLAGCSSDSSSSSATTDANASTFTTPPLSAVGQLSETFVDKSRPTPQWGSNPESDSRTLVTTILYPAEGKPEPGKATDGAKPARGADPYPVIVFAHGLGGDPQVYMPLLTHWAAAGFVVAAPLFPLSSSLTPGGPNAGDVKHQPEDMSFVLDSVLELSAGEKGALADLVDPEEAGAAGHSNGAVTTLGLVGNTCCRDTRFKAASILAGDLELFPGGEYDLDDAPPLLVLHGTEDELIPYDEGVDIFNEAKGPKGLLTIKDGNHGSAAGLVEESAPSVMKASTDFFKAYLLGDKGALERLSDDAEPGVTIMDFVSEAGSTVTIPTVPAPEVDLHATATPDTDLTDGQEVTVTWKGFTPGKVVSLLQCSADDADLTNQAGCDFKQAKLLQPDPTGEGSITMQVIVGKVGTGTCDADHPGCFILVNNASSPDPASMVKVPISFAP